MRNLAELLVLVAFGLCLVVVGHPASLATDTIA